MAPVLGGLLHGNRVPIIVFVDGIVLISHTTTGLQGLVDALDSFTSRQELVVNLGKTKVLAFDVSKATIDLMEIAFWDSVIETTTSYTYLRELFFGPYSP